jgi:predicted RNA-binding Zn-ribbon protein involved in translation (DUF1610 family)
MTDTSTSPGPVHCPTCNAPTPVPVGATAYRCPNCQQMWLFRECGQCKQMQFVAAEREQDWQCPDCAHRNRTGEGAAQRRGAAAVVVAGALLAGIGTASPWITIGAFDRSGFSYVSSDATIVLILAIAAALAAVAPVAGWELPRFVRPSILLIGIVIVVAGAYDVHQVQDRVDAVRKFASEAVDINASVGAGLWLVIAGGVAILLGGVALLGGPERLRQNLTGSARHFATTGSWRQDQP